MIIRKSWILFPTGEIFLLNLFCSSLPLLATLPSLYNLRKIQLKGLSGDDFTTALLTELQLLLVSAMSVTPRFNGSLILFRMTDWEDDWVSWLIN